MATLQETLRLGVRLAQVPDPHRIHEHCVIEAPADIAAEVDWTLPFRLGAFSHLNGGYLRSVAIGRYCSLARDVQIGHGFHPTDWLSVSPSQYSQGYRGWMRFVDPAESRPIMTRPFTSAAPTTIGHDVWLGNHVVVKDGVAIGNGAIVGAHAVVTRDVPAYSVVAGNPPRVIRMRFDEPIMERLEALQWWRYSLADFGALPFDRIEEALPRLEALLQGDIAPYVAPVAAAETLRTMAEGT